MHGGAKDADAAPASGVVSTPEGWTYVTFEVLGTPAPKGSSRAILIAGRAVNVPGGSNTNRTKLKSWDRNVRDRALEVLGVRTEPVFVGKALDVELVFQLARPSGHWSKKASGGLLPGAPRAPITKPDIDKLARATLDSLIGLAFDDDSRIARLLVQKEYAAPGREGALILVTEWITGPTSNDDQDED